jgi:hypothetical protein
LKTSSLVTRNAKTAINATVQPLGTNDPAAASNKREKETNSLVHPASITTSISANSQAGKPKSVIPLSTPREVAKTAIRSTVQKSKTTTCPVPLQKPSKQPSKFSRRAIKRAHRNEKGNNSTQIPLPHQLKRQRKLEVRQVRPGIGLDKPTHSMSRRSNSGKGLSVDDFNMEIDEYDRPVMREVKGTAKCGRSASIPMRANMLDGESRELNQVHQGRGSTWTIQS